MKGLTMIVSEGEVNFPTRSERKRHKAKFVLLKDGDDANEGMQRVIQTMFDVWQLCKPDLVLSFHGGSDAQSGDIGEDMENGVTEGICRLISAVGSAWLLTKAGDADALRIMEGVRKRVSVKDRDKLVSVGFTTLHSVHGSPFNIVTDEQTAGSGAVTKQAFSSKSHFIASQPPPQTHLVLIDNQSEDTEAMFRDKLMAGLETLLASYHSLKPTVFIQMQTDVRSVASISDAIARRSPIVVCEHTEREDFLSYALDCEDIGQFKERYANYFKRDFELKYPDADSQTRQKLLDECLKHVESIIHSKDLIKLFTVATSNRSSSFDFTVLLALLKAWGASRDFFYLAFSWNRSDIAREMVLRHGLVISEADKAELMTRALSDDDNRLRFIELLLDCGLVLEDYLNEETLDKLYELNAHRSDMTLIPKLKEGRKSYQESVNGLLQNVMRGHFTKQRDSRPYTELFIWSLVVNRSDLAEFFWAGCAEPIAAALVASRYYSYVAGRGFPDPDDTTNRYQMSDYFEEKACSILTETENVDPTAAFQIVRHRYPVYGDLDLLDLGALASCKRFVAHHACQMVLDRRWDGDIVEPWCKKVFVPILFPPLIFSRFQFRTANTCLGKISAFYSAPVTKFVFHWIMWLGFVILYSHVAIHLRRYPFSIADYVLHIWLLILLMEEVRQMLIPSDERETVHRRFKSHWRSVWNWFDFVSLLCAAAAFGLRFHDNSVSFEVVKVLYAISCCLFWLRMMRAYGFNENLGTFVIMIRGMIKEMYWFLWVLLVVIIAFGVAINIIISDGRTPSVGILNDVFYIPYFQLFGEFFFDSMNSTHPQGFPNSVTSVAFSVFLAIYLLIGNVLMLNLLIAIFSGVYAGIEANSRMEWRHKRYFLVRDYADKPAIPAPLIVFAYVYRAIQCCMSVCRKQGQTAVDHEKTRLINEVELECVDSYRRGQSQNESSVLEEKVSQLEIRLKHMERLLEDSYK